MSKLTEDLADRDPGLIFKPGFYYVALWHLSLPDHLTKFNNGGDITYMLFRRESEPTTWRVKWRFRHYKEGPDPFDGKDVFHWYSGTKSHATEGQAIEMVESIIGGTIAVSDGKANLRSVLWIKGNHEAFFDAIQRNKPDWMHYQAIERVLHRSRSTDSRPAPPALGDRRPDRFPPRARPPLHQ